MKLRNFAGLLVGLCLVQMGTARADTSLAEGLRQCAAITDTEKRTACYDALATTSQGPAGFGRDSNALDSIEETVAMRATRSFPAICCAFAQVKRCRLMERCSKGTAALMNRWSQVNQYRSKNRPATE